MSKDAAETVVRSTCSSRYSSRFNRALGSAASSEYTGRLVLTHGNSSTQVAFPGHTVASFAGRAASYCSKVEFSPPEDRALASGCFSCRPDQRSLI